MEPKDLKEAAEKYEGNGWNEADQLVLYRLEKCETNLTKLVNKRNKDVEESKAQRKDHYEQLKGSIDELKDVFTAYVLKCTEDEIAKAEKDAELRNDIKSNSDRLSRLEKLLYAVLGTSGIYVVSRVLEHVLA